jgi:hypothetical protein
VSKQQEPKGILPEPPKPKGVLGDLPKSPESKGVGRRAEA